MITEKTLQKLQYPLVLEEVSKFAISSIAVRKVLDMKPANTFEEMQLLQDETTQATRLFDFETSFDLSLDDISEIVSLVKVGSCLSMGQLLAVMRTLRTARLLQSALMKDYGIDIGLLQAKAGTLYADKRIEDEIDFAIISDEEMNDRASDELYAIRKKIREINLDIKQKLQSYSKNSDLSKYLQDSIVTLRGDRYVLPVKQEYKNYVSGIVHDQSASGSTLFIEPMAVVQLNNNLREAVLQEREEMQRILQSFTDRLTPIYRMLQNNLETISDIDVIFSRVKYGIANRCTKPVLNCEGTIKLKNARHPLIDKQKVVPISFEIGKQSNIVVVTGTNTGGKTVTLKTVGLLTALAMAGMFVPCTEESEVSFFKSIYCDIGDEQSIEQSLSTFSGHMTNLRDILNDVTSDSLVLIDEVGAGTEPNEGSALAVAITEFLRKSGCKAVITTHYGKLKEYSLITDGVENASMQFNPETYEPTYKLVMGVPGSSNAIAIASRLGLDSTVIDMAKKYVDGDSVQLEQVLSNAESIRKEYEDKVAETNELNRSLQQELEKSKKLNQSLSAEREKLLSGSRQEARRIVADAQRECKDIIAQIKDLLNSDVSDKALFEARALAKKVANAMPEEEKDDDYVFTGDKIKFSDLKKGMTAFCSKINSTVTVAEIKSPSKIIVKAGNMTVNVAADDLFYYKQDKKVVKQTHSKTAHRQVDSRSYSNEINVLGQTVDEAIANVDDFIDRAVLGGLSTVWVIHGMGTGRLRQGLHQHFKHHPNIAEFRLGRPGEGDSGVTVVTLK